MPKFSPEHSKTEIEPTGGPPPELFYGWDHFHKNVIPEPWKDDLSFFKKVVYGADACVSSPDFKEWEKKTNMVGKSM